MRHLMGAVTANSRQTIDANGINNERRVSGGVKQEKRTVPVKNRGDSLKIDIFMNGRNSSTCRTLDKNYTSMKRSF